MLPKEKRSPDQEHKEISKRQVAEEKLRKVIAEETRSDRQKYAIQYRRGRSVSLYSLYFFDQGENVVIISMEVKLEMDLLKNPHKTECLFFCSFFVCPRYDSSSQVLFEKGCPGSLARVHISLAWLLFVSLSYRVLVKTGNVML